MFSVVILNGSETNSEVWQGSFNTPGMWGAMEMEITPSSGMRVRLRLTPAGHLEVPAVRDEAISRNQVSFFAALKDIDAFYQRHFNLLAQARSDTAAARDMQEAKRRLFQGFRQERKTA